MLQLSALFSFSRHPQGFHFDERGGGDVALLCAKGILDLGEAAGEFLVRIA